MKTKIVLLALACTAARLAAETLSADTAVFTQTDPTSFVLARLKAGATLTVVGDAPAGWRRVEVNGPFEAFALNRDITKGLDVREGANIYAAPSKDAAVLTVSAPGDKTEVTGLHGRDWVQIKLDKKLQGFIAVGETANVSATAQPGLTSNLPPPPVAPVSTVGHPVPITGNSASMPRLFAGILVSAKRLLNPNPVYDYQLVDASGRRFAYVDTKRLVLTDKIDAFLNLSVTITGTVRNTVDGKDLVIAAEAMQVK